MLGVKEEEEEEEEEELIVAVAVATARIIVCARYVSAFARYNRYYIDIPDWIKRGPLKETESAILLFGLFSVVRAIRFRRKEEEEDLYLVRRLSLSVCVSVLLCFLFLFASARRRRVVRVCAGAFLLLFCVVGEK